jgi:putative thioredoxin
MSPYDLQHEDQFRTDVLEASRSVPVLVDFWAAWCGPCRMVGPILEKLAGEEAAKPAPAWKLVKLDTERFPDIAQAFRIQGIPNMKLFVDGAVTAELSGALPEHELRRWLAEQLPSPAKEALAEGLRRLGEGRTAEAEAPLREALDAGLEEARAALAAALLWDRPAEAAELAAHSGLSEREEAVRTLAPWLMEDASARPEGPAAAPFAEALEAARRGAFGEALEHGIRAVALDKGWYDEAPRRLVVALFQWLGPQHGLVAEYRRAFSMALY